MFRFSFSLYRLIETVNVKLVSLRPVRSYRRMFLPSLELFHSEGIPLEPASPFSSMSKIGCFRKRYWESGNVDLSNFVENDRKFGNQVSGRSNESLEYIPTSRSRPRIEALPSWRRRQEREPVAIQAYWEVQRRTFDRQRFLRSGGACLSCPETFR